MIELDSNRKNKSHGLYGFKTYLYLLLFFGFYWFLLQLLLESIFEVLGILVVRTVAQLSAKQNFLDPRRHGLESSSLLLNNGGGLGGARPTRPFCSFKAHAHQYASFAGYQAAGVKNN